MKLEVSMKVALVACAKKKRKGVHRACDLYVSSLFRSALEYVQHRFEQYYVLSAKYGLLHPNTEVRDYDETLNAIHVNERRKWASDVAVNIRKHIPKGSEIHFFAGVKYRKELMRLLAADYRFKTPLKGLSIGRQLQWYKHKNCKNGS